MYIVPNSTVKFYGDIPIVTGRQIAFSSKAKQNAYFASKLIATYTPTSYCRPNEKLRVDSSVLSYTTAMHINYLSFVNPDFENIVWYAKVTSTDYLNNGCVLITFALDLFQTFMNEIDFDTCVLDREQLSVADYEKSVNNPYDYSIIEMQTEEGLPLDNFCYDFPAITGRSGNYGPKRTFLPGGYEDDSYEKTADNTFLYTIVMSSPINRFIQDDTRYHSADFKYIDYKKSIKSELTGFFTDYEGLFPEDSMIGMFNDAGYWDAWAQMKGWQAANDPYLPVGNKLNRLKLDLKTQDEKSWTIGASWVAWPYATGNETPNSGGKYDAGYGLFCSRMNNISNQTLILGTSDYTKMNRILNTIVENDAVSSIVGCYYLPLSFLIMLHASTGVQSKTLSTSYIPLFDGGSAPSDYGPDGTSLNDTHNRITVFTEEVHPLDFNQVKNKKLLTFPYQYIRVSDPSGMKKEYKFEEFPALQSKKSGDENDFNVKFTMLADITPTPKLEMYPYLYKMYETGDDVRMSFRKKLNVEERMEYTEIPQQSYMTDAFTAYIASTYAQQSAINATNRLWSADSSANELASNIATSAKYSAGSKKGLIGGINAMLNGGVDTSVASAKNPFTVENYASSVDASGQVSYFNSAGEQMFNVGSQLSANNGTALGSAAAALRTGASIGRNFANSFGPGAKQTRETEANQIASSAENMIAEVRVRESALEWANGNFAVNPYLAKAKSSFRVNDYHAGTGSGILPYFLGGFKFTFDVMKLKPEFIRKYDEYFTNYGYSSTRVGIPHIQEYLHGTKTGDAPKFLQNEDGYYVTFVKTVICKVNHYNSSIANFIEGLFDAGIQLIDGDTLI